jgi:hypothetical protein
MLFAVLASGLSVSVVKGAAECEDAADGVGMIAVGRGGGVRVEETVDYVRLTVVDCVALGLSLSVTKTAFGGEMKIAFVPIIKDVDDIIVFLLVLGSIV